MPELPDISVYIRALEPRLVGHTLTGVRLNSIFLLHTAVPPLSSLYGQEVTAISRIGKRICIHFRQHPENLALVLHLMISGRLHWKEKQPIRVSGKMNLASFDFDSGSLQLTEASTQKRATLHVVTSEDLRQFDRGGIEVLTSDIAAFTETLSRENRTLKRALTDPRLFSGIGNAYSDEILHRSRLSPFKLTTQMIPQEIQRLHNAVQSVMTEWIDRLTVEAAGGFPEHVTAFRPEMAVHGKYNFPCPICKTPIQRIRYAENECNYCPECQTGGKLLADRGLSRLLKEDWPRSLVQLEQIKMHHRNS